MKIKESSLVDEIKYHVSFYTAFRDHGFIVDVFGIMNITLKDKTIISNVRFTWTYDAIMIDPRDITKLRDSNDPKELRLLEEVESIIEDKDCIIKSNIKEAIKNIEDTKFSGIIGEKYEPQCSCSTCRERLLAKYVVKH